MQTMNSKDCPCEGVSSNPTCWWDDSRRHQAWDRMWHDMRILWGGDTLSPLRRPSRSRTETNKQKKFLQLSCCLTHHFKVVSSGNMDCK